jgi:hypothetical protein
MVLPLLLAVNPFSMNLSVFRTMSLCSSCKSKTSKERCSAKSVGDTLFCRRHVKVKVPRLWAVINNVDPCAIMIQKVWRGYSVRNWIRLAGPGAINRTKCHNDEELFTLDGKMSVSPFSYFAFDEAGKIYWFDIRSLSQHCLKTMTNPYTRQPLTIENRKRLRKLSIMRHRRKLPYIHESSQQTDINQVITEIWTSISQIIEENGFFDVNPRTFSSLNRSQLYVFLLMISNDLKAWAVEHNSKYSSRHKYFVWTWKILKLFTPATHPLKIQFMVAKVLLNILYDGIAPYNVCFIIMSSLYRL